MKQGTTEKVKFKKLKRRLRLPEWQVGGLLDAIWRSTASNAPAGDIGRLSNEDIAASIEYEDDPDELVQHLVECGWLDEDDEFRLIVHDWSDHVPNFLKGGFAKSGRTFADQIVKAREGAKQVAKQVAKHPAKQVASEPAKLPPTKPSQYKLSQAEPSQAIQTPSTKVDDAFDRFWDAVHLKVGKDASKRAFEQAAKRKAKEGTFNLPTCREFIIDAMCEFADSPEASPKDRTPIHPTTWLNQGRYDDDRATWQQTTGTKQTERVIF